MLLSSSQQLVVAFTAVLLVFVLFPRMFGGGGSGDGQPRINRRGPGPGGVKSQQQIHRNAAPPMSQSLENMQPMKKLMEQELKSDKYKPNSNKGYVFTLMPIYAIGVGLFAAYKFLKIKSASDSEAQKAKTARGVKKSVKTENVIREDSREMTGKHWEERRERDLHWTLRWDSNSTLTARLSLQRECYF